MKEQNVGIIPSKDKANRGLQRKPYKRVPNGTRQWWSDGAKVDAVKTFLVLGNMSDVHKALGIPYDTLRHWHISDWWTEIEDNLKAEENIELSARLKLRINKALEVTLDRLENGDFQYDPRTGKFVRKPVSLRDVNMVLKDMIKSKKDIDAVPVEAQNKQAVIDTLAKLTIEFAKMAGRRKPVTIEGEIIEQESLPQATNP